MKLQGGQEDEAIRDGLAEYALRSPREEEQSLGIREREYEAYCEEGPARSHMTAGTHTDDLREERIQAAPDEALNCEVKGIRETGECERGEKGARDGSRVLKVVVLPARLSRAACRTGAADLVQVRWCHAILENVVDGVQCPALLHLAIGTDGDVRGEGELKQESRQERASLLLFIGLWPIGRLQRDRHERMDA
jgi:hypothetical protein